MCVMKYTDISKNVQRRARKVTDPRGVFLLNNFVAKDIYYRLCNTFPRYFQKQVKVAMVDGVTSYALPSDFYAVRRVYDESGNTVLRGSNSLLDSSLKGKVQIYGGNLVVDAENTYTSLFVEYCIAMPAFDETTDIDLPSDIAAALELIWVTGLEYFYFSENKKTQETQTSFARYNDAKDAVLTFSTGTFSLS